MYRTELEAGELTYGRARARAWKESLISAPGLCGGELALMLKFFTCMTF